MQIHEGNNKMLGKLRTCSLGHSFPTGVTQILKVSAKYN